MVVVGATNSCRLRLVSAQHSVQLLYWGPDPIALPLPRVRYVGPVSCCSLHARVGYGTHTGDASQRR